MRKDAEDGSGKLVEPDYEVHYADGRRLEQPMPVSQILNAQLHQGLQDARRYDEFSIDENHPLSQERAAVDELTRTAEAIANEYAVDVLRERDITRVKWEQFRGAVSDLDALRERRTELARDIENELTELEEPSSPRHVSQARLRTAPERTMHRIPWVLFIIAAIGGLAELVVNFLAAQALRESALTTWSFALAISFTTIMLPWWAARYLSDPAARFRWIAQAALGCLAVTLLGLGWLRYAYSSGRMEAGLQKQHQTLTTAGALAIAMFSIFLPLCLSLLIMIKVLHDRHDVTYQTWSNRRSLARLDAQISDKEEELAGKERVYHDALDFGERLRTQAVTAIHAYRATMGQAVESYFDGLGQGLANPAATAVLDRRFVNFQRAFHEEGDEIVAKAIGMMVPEPIWSPESDVVARHLRPDDAEGRSAVPGVEPAAQSEPVTAVNQDAAMASAPLAEGMVGADD